MWFLIFWMVQYEILPFSFFKKWNKITGFLKSARIFQTRNFCGFFVCKILICDMKKWQISQIFGVLGSTSRPNTSPSGRPSTRNAGRSSSAGDARRSTTPSPSRSTSRNARWHRPHPELPEPWNIPSELGQDQIKINKFARISKLMPTYYPWSILFWY